MSQFLSETKINSIDSEHWHPPSFCRPIKKQPDPPAARVHSNPAATGRAHPVCVSRTLIHWIILFSAAAGCALSQSAGTFTRREVMRACEFIFGCGLRAYQI